MTNPDNAAAFSRFLAELLADQSSSLDMPAPNTGGEFTTDDLKTLIEGDNA